MEIFPAIDLRGGKAVRLYQGNYENMTVYADDPTQMAQAFAAAGAKNLHLVDLDGAKNGAPVNFDVITRMAQTKAFFVQVGGGIRDESRIEDYLSRGANRIILGTVAVRDFAFVEAMVQRYGAAIAVGVDARDGFVAVSGWLEVTKIPSVEFCRQCAQAGVQTIIYTDISKDGALAGTNLEVYQTLGEIKGLNVVASGGVSSLAEIRTLAARGTYGAIVGKALYEGVLDLPACLAAAKSAGEEIT